MRSDDILSLIDTALGDDSVSGDAMRSNPNTEAPAVPEPVAMVPGLTGRLAEIARHGNRGVLNGNSKITCADGFTLSVIAGPGTYCHPRPVLPLLANSLLRHADEIDTGYPGPYTEVEVGYPSERPEPWDQWSQRCEDDADPTDTIYGYMPVATVQALIDCHGGER